MVWALPCSIATTKGITIVFFSSGYLDVSVLRVSFTPESVMIPLQGIGFPHSEIFGYNGYLHLAEAYRSLSRPSSPLRAKASTKRPCLLFLLFLLDFVLSLYFQYVKEPFRVC